MHEVTVAALPAFTPLFRFPDSPRYGTTWEHLPKTVVQAASRDTLREVLRRACRQLDIELTPEAIEAHESYARASGRPLPSTNPADHLVFVRFRTDGDDEIAHPDPEYPVLRRDVPSPLTVVVTRNPAGQAVWRRPPFDATLAELLDAQDAGLLEGDPLQPYLIPAVPQGDIGALTEWLSFKDALAALVVAAQALATADGLLGMRDRALALLERRRQTPAVVERHATEWAERGAAPHDLPDLLAARPRPSVEVAALLGCTIGEAESLLWGLGFTADEDGRWVRGSDPVARLIAGDVSLSFMDRVVVAGDTAWLREIAVRRGAAVLEGGEAPPPSSVIDEEQRRMAEEAAELLDRPRRLHRLLQHLRRFRRRER